MSTSFTPAGVPAAWVVLPTRWTAGGRAPRAAEAGAGAGGARRRVLIVDDEWLISMQLEQIVTAAGLEVVGIAADAAGAVALAGRERPDLVLMDIRLNGPVDGIEAAREIVDRFGIRSLFVSTHSDPATVARGGTVTPAGWLPKPFTEAELLRAVRAALSPP
jgi:DNA-binding NarL/FixJ family response regulator